MTPKTFQLYPPVFQQTWLAKKIQPIFQQKIYIPSDSKWPFWDGENVTLFNGEVTSN